MSGAASARPGGAGGAASTRRPATGLGRGLRSLDWLNFFIAGAQTGFGPFIAVYLTAHRWTQVEIGEALSLGAIVSMASQVPAGALIDQMNKKRTAAGIAAVAIAVSALILGAWPERPAVLGAEALFNFATSMVVPAVAAISLARVSRRESGPRLGRNARWASLGNGLCALALGAVGYYTSYRAVFLLSAVLALPVLATLVTLSRHGAPRHAGSAVHHAGPARPPWRLLLDRRLQVFCACALLFQLANAAMLQLVGGEATKRFGTGANLIIAACIVVPQLVVAALSPAIGALSERRGRRPILILGFLALPIRSLLFALVGSGYAVVPIQVLDGIGGATFGVLTPLVAADVAAGTGRFNLCLGIFGLAGGLGASLSTTLAGVIADESSPTVAFLGLAVAGFAAVLVAWTLLPETRAS